VKLCTLIILFATTTTLPAPRPLSAPTQQSPAGQQSPAAPAQASSPAQSPTPILIPVPAQNATPPAVSQPTPGQAINEPPVPPLEGRSPDWAPLQYVDTWNRGTFDALWFHTNVLARATFITSHGKFQPFLLPRFQKVIGSWHDAAPDLHFDVKDTIISADGKKAVLRLLGHGTFSKPLFGPLGGNALRKVFWTETLIFELQDGKIYQIWEDYDESRMHLAMGQHYCMNDEGNPATNGAPTAAPPATPQPAPTTPSTPPAEPPAKP
jgi:predicted ester cyclase